MLDGIKSLLGISGPSVSVPSILQMEGTECGAASLAMIFAYYGSWIPLERMRQECGVSRDGSKASRIVMAGRRMGMDTKGFRRKADDLPQVKMPAIIHWEFNHFVVLEGISGGYAYISDPARGKRRIPWDEFKSSYTGIVITAEPGKDFKPEGKPYSIVAAVADKLREDKWAMILMMLIGLALIVPGLASPVFGQIFMDDIISMKHPDWMFKLSLAMLLSIVLLLVLNSLRAAVLTQWQRKLTIADSSRFFWHTLRLPMQFFQQRYAAEIASRIPMNEEVASTLTSSAATAVLDLLVAIFYLLLLLQYSVPLTIIGVGFSLLNVLVFKVLRKKITELNMQIRQASGKEYGTLMNGLSIIESIKANGTEGDFFSKWAGYHAKAKRSEQDAQLWGLCRTVLPTFFGGINTALILTVGGFSIIEGVMTVGIFTGFQNLMGSFQAPLNKLVELGNTLQTTEMQMNSLNDVYRYPIDKLNYADEGKEYSYKGKHLNGDLLLRGVTFGYSPQDPPILENFDLHVEPGRWAAIVGFSGSGKSTLAKIVTGIYKEWSGDVLFDGASRAEIPRAVIVSSLASVDQDVFMISGTVEQNIALFDDSISRADIVQAAKDACIHEDIMKMEGAYSAQVREGGSNFSGGQRQRLEIARALAVNPSILVLDEATSALDPVTEKRVMDNIRRRGCTCFIVAHRLSTIRDCDEIVVLDRGKVVERGTHREMIRHEGPYWKLVAKQEEKNE